jgi:GINS complex subunit 1
MGGAWEGKDLIATSTSSGMVEGGAGGNAGNGQGEQQQRSNLAPEEQELFRQYTDFLSMYKGQFTDIDLTGSLVPPRDLFVDVRVLKDAGEIQTEYGVLNLTKNSQLHVRLGDVERLIGLGFVERVR